MTLMTMTMPTHFKSLYVPESGFVGQPTNPDFFLIQFLFGFDPDFLCIPPLGQFFWRQLYEDKGSHIQIMNAHSQAQGGCVGHAGGVPNYKNDIFINIIKWMLPQGLEA